MKRQNRSELGRYRHSSRTRSPKAAIHNNRRNSSTTLKDNLRRRDLSGVLSMCGPSMTGTLIYRHLLQNGKMLAGPVFFDYYAVLGDLHYPGA